MEAEEIKIGGKWLRFDQGCVIRMREKIDRDDIGATTGYALAWGALKSYAYANNIKVTDDFKTVCGWVDGLKAAEVLKIMEAFQRAEAYKNLLPKDETDKKKLQKKSTKRSVLK